MTLELLGIVYALAWIWHARRWARENYLENESSLTFFCWMIAIVWPVVDVCVLISWTNKNHHNMWNRVFMAAPSRKERRELEISAREQRIAKLEAELELDK